MATKEWFELTAAVDVWNASPKSADSAAQFDKAVIAYAMARGYQKASHLTPPQYLPGAFVVPFGKNKGKHLPQLATSDIEWLARAWEENIANPAKEKWREKTEEELVLLRAELDRRSGG